MAARHQGLSPPHTQILQAETTLIYFISFVNISNKIIETEIRSRNVGLGLILRTTTYVRIHRTKTKKLSDIFGHNQWLGRQPVFED